MITTRVFDFTQIDDSLAEVPEFVRETPEGDYIIFLNARFTAERRREAYDHALLHIAFDDFNGESADAVERARHF